MAGGNKIVSYCALVLGRPKLCFGKSTIRRQFSFGNAPKRPYAVINYCGYQLY